MQRTRPCCKETVSQTPRSQVRPRPPSGPRGALGHQLVRALPKGLASVCDRYSPRWPGAQEPGLDKPYIASELSDERVFSATAGLFITSKTVLPSQKHGGGSGKGAATRLLPEQKPLMPHITLSGVGVWLRPTGSRDKESPVCGEVHLRLGPMNLGAHKQTCAREPWSGLAASPWSPPPSTSSLGAASQRDPLLPWPSPGPCFAQSSKL